MNYYYPLGVADGSGNSEDDSFAGDLRSIIDVWLGSV